MDMIRVRPGQSRHPCDEGGLVFCEGTGTTSLVGPPHAAILDLLSDSAAHPAGEVFAAYSAKEDIERPAFDLLVASLEDSGLIIRC